MNEIVLIFGMAFVTFAIRYLMIPLSGKLEFPDCLERALRYVPPAVLTAIIVPSVLMPAGNMFLSFENAYLVGATGACAAGWMTRNLLFTIVFGMAVFLGWQWHVGII